MTKTVEEVSEDFVKGETIIIDTADPKNPYKKWLTKFLGENKEIPDAVDLYDFLGFGLWRSRKYLPPFVQSFAKELQ